MAVVAGCQEVQGACLEKVALEMAVVALARGARGLLGRLETRAERSGGLRGRVGLERLAEGLEGLEGLRGLRPGKRQPWTPLKTDGRGDWLPEVAEGGLPWKCLRKVWRVWRVWGVWRRANGSVERLAKKEGRGGKDCRKARFEREGCLGK